MFYSLIFHAILIALFIYFRTQSRPQSELVTYVELLPAQKDPPKALPVAVRGKARSGMKWAPPSMTSLGQPLGLTSAQGSSPGAIGDAYKTADSMDIPAEARFFSEAELVWRRLNETVDYPMDLAEERIEGKVNIQFSLDEKGNLLDLHSISGENTILNTFVAAETIQAFREKLPRNLKQKKNLFACQFVFSIILDETDRDKELIPHFKNILTIERKVRLDPVAMEEAKYWIDRIPVKPTPVGPIVDFVAFYQLYNDQVKPDPAWRRKQRTMQNLELWAAELERFQNRKKEENI